MGWHPCWHHTCCENYRGQCYGGGCSLNPAPGGEDDRDEREDEDEEADDKADETEGGEQ